jgi:hypothetical protein
MRPLRGSWGSAEPSGRVPIVKGSSFGLVAGSAATGSSGCASVMPSAAAMSLVSCCSCGRVKEWSSSCGWWEGWWWGLYGDPGGAAAACGAWMACCSEWCGSCLLAGTANQYATAPTALHVLRACHGVPQVCVTVSCSSCQGSTQQQDQAAAVCRPAHLFLVSRQPHAVLSLQLSSSHVLAVFLLHFASTLGP